MTIIESKYEISDNTNDTEHTTQAETLNVIVNGKIMLCIDSSGEDLSIRVYPLTKGELWDAPHEEFTVDYAEIAKLEKDMG